MPWFDVTVRYGVDRLRYHTFEVEARDVREALRRAADEIPDPIGSAGTLVEIRLAPPPDAGPGS